MCTCVAVDLGEMKSGACVSYYSIIFKYIACMCLCISCLCVSAAVDLGEMMSGARV